MKYAVISCSYGYWFIAELLISLSSQVFLNVAKLSGVDEDDSACQLLLTDLHADGS